MNRQLGLEMTDINQRNIRGKAQGAMAPHRIPAKDSALSNHNFSLLPRICCRAFKVTVLNFLQDVRRYCVSAAALG
jgi:hypothetical protein